MAALIASYAAGVLWWQVVQEQRAALDKQQVELAVTGAAFTRLQQSEGMEQLLFNTRIFARFAPDQKVRTAIPAVCMCAGTGPVLWKRMPLLAVPNTTDYCRPVLVRLLIGHTVVHDAAAIVLSCYEHATCMLPGGNHIPVGLNMHDCNTERYRQMWWGCTRGRG